MAAEQEALDVGALEEYMAEPTVLPAFYKKKDLLIYAVGIGERPHRQHHPSPSLRSSALLLSGCTEDKFTYELCGGPVGEETNRFEMFPTFPFSSEQFCPTKQYNPPPRQHSPTRLKTIA